MRDDGILAGDFDISSRPKRQGPSYTPVAARLGLVIEHNASGTTGAIVKFNPPQVVLRDRDGRDHTFRVLDGAFSIDGQSVILKRPPTEVGPSTAPGFTASGSIDLGDTPARVARGSRIYVEGIHDAELVEKVWGDDLRVEGIVVQQIEGADDLEYVVRSFGPHGHRKLGILLDHLVDGSKESRLASTVDHPAVLITGHPFVDIWAAVKPKVVGLDAWPDIPKGQPWKEGVMAAVGFTGNAGEFWKQLLGRVETWTDLEPALVGAVEQLIDFVAPPEG
ncbi:MAG: DUF3097 family protein [Acidimicrobiales bacterium]|nr:DUF3097 family protein [Acidimicrobiales bacterium]